jgi:hypothetical protein
MPSDSGDDSGHWVSYYGINDFSGRINQYEVEVDTTKYYLIQSYGNAPVGKPLNYTLDKLFGPTVPGGVRQLRSFNQTDRPRTLTNGTFLLLKL